MGPGGQEQARQQVKVQEVGRDGHRAAHADGLGGAVGLQQLEELVLHHQQPLEHRLLMLDWR